MTTKIEATATPEPPNSDRADIKSVFSPGATLAYAFILIVLLFGVLGYGAIMETLKPMAANVVEIKAAVVIKK